MKKIILASSNQGKIEEIKALTHHLNLSIVPQGELQISDAEETGSTFIENALIKARHACSMGSLPAIADDSGLVVPAINGEPGIYSARYAGDKTNDIRNTEKLLARLEVTPNSKREAYFYCVMVFLRDPKDPCPIIGEGIWHGEILLEPVGDYGFGYDPIFFDPLHQCSVAQLRPEVKNSISHRGQAIKVLIERMTQSLS